MSTRFVAVCGGKKVSNWVSEVSDQLRDHARSTVLCTTFSVCSRDTSTSSVWWVPPCISICWSCLSLSLHCLLIYPTILSHSHIKAKLSSPSLETWLWTCWVRLFCRSHFQNPTQTRILQMSYLSSHTDPTRFGVGWVNRAGGETSEEPSCPTKGTTKSRWDEGV